MKHALGVGLFPLHLHYTRASDHRQHRRSITRTNSVIRVNDDETVQVYRVRFA